MAQVESDIVLQPFLPVLCALEQPDKFYTRIFGQRRINDQIFLVSKDANMGHIVELHDPDEGRIGQHPIRLFELFDEVVCVNNGITSDVTPDRFNVFDKSRSSGNLSQRSRV